MPMTFTHGSNARIKEFAIVDLVNANASLVMKVLLASVQFVLTTAMIAELAGQKSI